MNTSISYSYDSKSGRGEAYLRTSDFNTTVYVAGGSRTIFATVTVSRDQLLELRDQLNKDFPLENDGQYASAEPSEPEEPSEDGLYTTQKRCPIIRRRGRPLNLLTSCPPSERWKTWHEIVKRFAPDEFPLTLVNVTQDTTSAKGE